MTEDPRSPHSAADRWDLVQRLFHGALEQAADERGAWLRARAAGDDGLVREVEELLAEDARPGSILDTSVEALAGRVLHRPDEVPDTIGPYRIVSRLGVGGMGTVYLAERDDLGSRAAIKILRDASLSAARRERFRLEQRILAQLTDPGIARIYDADTLPDGTPYFVMEYVEGETVTKYCEAHKLGLTERMALFRGVCEAVSAAHRQAVVHRDLKPSNILVTPDGTPKLLDFGISKSLDPLEGGSALATGLQLMTPAYAAPEQVLGTPVGVYTDVYALGVLLYELLTGRLPFALDGLAPRDAQDRILEGTAPPPSVVLRAHRTNDESGRPPIDGTSVSRSTLDDLDTLCGVAMHKDPARRYSTVEALVRDLDHFARYEPLEARPDNWTYRTSRFLRRNRRAVAATTVLVSAIVGLVVFFGVRLRDARDLALDEAARARRIQAFTQNLFSGGEASVGPADTLRVTTLLERGVQEARLLEADPDQQSTLYVTLGTIFGQLGRLERADSLLALALRIRASGTGDAAAAARLADVHHAIGELRLRGGDYAEAEGAFREALTARTGGVGAEASVAAGVTDPEVALALVGLGAALEGQGSYDEALVLLDEAVQSLARTPGREEDLSSALAAAANTHFYAGDLDASDSLNLQALEIHRRLHGEAHPDVADALINLSVSEFQRGRYVEGEPLLRDALRIFEDYHGPEHPEVASALRLLGQNLIYQGRLEDAEPLLRRSLAIGERTLGADHPRHANTLGDLAYIELQDGRYEEAVDAYRRIVGIYESSNGPRHYFVGIGLSNLANALMEGGRLPESEVIFRDVIERFVEARGAEHIDTGIARIKLGRVLLRQGRAAEAERELQLGYELVSAQAEPSVSWLRAARTDLASAYDAMGRPEDAARFRAEQAAVDSASAAP